MGSDQPPKEEKAASPWKLLIGAIGIFGAFTFYGTLMDDALKFEDPSKNKFTFSWFLSVLEALANVIVGFIGLLLTQGKPSESIPVRGFLLTGATQVMSKTMFTQAQLFGLPFFLATLVKNAKMLPVMVGAIVTTGKFYALRKWLQVGLIIGGCVLVTVGKKSKPKDPAAVEDNSTEMYGFLCLALSLVGDGVTGGTQTGMKDEYKKKTGKKLQPYDLMLFTNLAMLLVALAASLYTNEFLSGIAFVAANPTLLPILVTFSFCSAIGQSAIFFTMANFGPLEVTTITTCRKIFSVLLGIVKDGKKLENLQYGGVVVATLGVLGELQEKYGGKNKGKAH